MIIALSLLLACGSSEAPPPEPEPKEAPAPAPDPEPAPKKGKTKGKAKAGGKAKSIDCGTTGYTLQGKVGDRITVSCGSCSTGSVWGDGRYTPDTAICRAAVHAGAIPAKGGRAVVVFKEKFGPFEAADRNGVSSSSWSSEYEPTLVIKPARKR